MYLVQSIRYLWKTDELGGKVSVGQPKRVAANRVVLMRKQKMCQFEASSQQGYDLFKLTHFQYVQM